MMEMLIIVSRIAETFNLEIPEGYVPEAEPGITLKAKGGIELILRKLQ
jgi:hypothetical protein